MQYVTPIKKKEKDKRMKLLVEAVSKFGFKAVNGGQSIWHNADKKTQPDLSPIRQGDELEAEVNGKWVKSFTIVSRGNPVENKKPESAAAQNKQYAEPVSRKEDAAMGVRVSALKAAFGAAFSAYAKDGDEAEAFQKALDVVDRVAEYIENGRPEAA